MAKVTILQHADDVPAGSLIETFHRAGILTETVRLFETLPDSFPTEELAGLVVLGGPMCANDTEAHKFLAVELNWMRSAVEQGVPLLGLCLGAQLLAKAMGGRVYPHSRREIGWFEIDLLPAADNDPLFQGRKSPETVFQWHGDTFDLPPGAVLLARGRLCTNQAFRIGSNAYGLQFHAEMTPEIMKDWLVQKPSKATDRLCAPIDPMAITAESTVHFPVMNDFSEAILSRFAGLCAARAVAGRRLAV